MRVTFWGTRGSIAKPGETTVRYGGNTSCVHVQSAKGAQLVIDCGTGAHGLGQALLAAGTAQRGTLLIGHTHWDHINGFPFFAPLFSSDAEWDVMGPRGLGSSLQETLAGQMEYTYFPVTLEQLGATLRYHDLIEGVFAVGDMRVSTRYLNHPALTLAYRIECDGAVVVYMCDHEPYARDAATGATLRGMDLEHAQFAAGADLLIHDAQYLAAEYHERVGWGHSTVEYAAAVAQAARVKRLALTHHDPLRTDDELDAIADAVLDASGEIDVFPAREGLSIDVTGPVVVAVGGNGSLPAFALEDAMSDRRVLVRARQDAGNEALFAALRVEGIEREDVRDADDVYAAFTTGEPALALIDVAVARREAAALAHALHERAGPGGRTPLVLIADAEDARLAGELDADDWLIRPFSEQYARTKLRTWILRTACRWVRAATPSDEARRQAVVDALALFDQPPDPRFDRLVRLVAAVLGVRGAAFSVIDGDRQRLKSAVGVDWNESPRDAAFCAHVVAASESLVVEDALADDRFADNPFVTGAERLRFYAGAPVVVDGAVIGTLCAMDTHPRAFSENERALLHDLRDLLQAELDATPAPLV